MPTTIDRTELRRLLEREDVQLVEVLPRKEYEEEHLPGAINVPLHELERLAPERLRSDAPVVVYCHDYP